MLETTLLALADRFSYGSTAPESVAGGLANIRDMSEYWDMPSPLFSTAYILVIYWLYTGYILVIYWLYTSDDNAILCSISDRGV